MGTRTQKMRAVLAFYEKYAGSLGRGVWLDNFDRDSRFLPTHLRGSNPPACPCCSGAGEARAGSGCAAGDEFSPDYEQADVGEDSQGDKSSKAGSESPGPDEGGGLCSSMLCESDDCAGDRCGYSHECPCGADCYSAHDRPAFGDQDPSSGGDGDPFYLENLARETPFDTHGTHAGSLFGGAPFILTDNIWVL